MQKHPAMATKVTSGTWYELLSMTHSISFALRVRNELTISIPLHQSGRKASRNQSNVMAWPVRAVLSCSSYKASEMLCLEIKSFRYVHVKWMKCSETGPSTNVRIVAFQQKNKTLGRKHALAVKTATNFNGHKYSNRQWEMKGLKSNMHQSFTATMHCSFYNITGSHLLLM